MIQIMAIKDRLQLLTTLNSITKSLSLRLSNGPQALMRIVYLNQLMGSNLPCINCMNNCLKPTDFAGNIINIKK